MWCMGEPQWSCPVTDRHRALMGGPFAGQCHHLHFADQGAVVLRRHWPCIRSWLSGWGYLILEFGLLARTFSTTWAEHQGFFESSTDSCRNLNESKKISWIIKSLLPLYSLHRLVATVFIVSLLVNILALGDNISVITLHCSKVRQLAGPK